MIKKYRTRAKINASSNRSEDLANKILKLEKEQREIVKFGIIKIMTLVILCLCGLVGQTKPMLFISVIVLVATLPLHIGRNHESRN